MIRLLMLIYSFVVIVVRIYLITLTTILIGSMKTCYNCKFALLRSQTTKHFNYECCELGLIPMQVNLPVTDMSTCPGWKRGKEKEVKELKISIE